MKKILCLLLTIISLLSLVACGATDPEPATPKEPYLNVQQELVNICCDYSNCNSVKGFEIGTQSKTPIENGYKVVAKGSYWPVDAYGDIEDKMLFDITFEATWNGKSSFYYIDVIKKSIRRKY